MTANAKNLSTLANVLDDGTSGQILQSTGSGGVVFANIAAGASVYDSAALLPLAGNDAGDMAFVTATSHFYINNGTGWYSVNLINTDPAITSVQDASANTTPFTLSTDGSATVITVTANDPENVPLTYSYAVTAGSLTNGGGTTATVTQSDNVFTVTPSTTEAYAGTFNLTFTASDGINTATSDNSFTLQFITTITNSKYTTLLATATPKNTTVYRYFKFLPQAMRSATPDAMQYSEFELTDGTSYYSPSSASQLYRADDTDGDDYAANQNVAASIDGNTSTKLYNGGWASKYYLYDMGSSFSTALTGWRYKTGNDMDSRDPISWTLLGSTNNSDWVLLDQRVNETITTSRQTATQDFTFNATNQAFFNAANSNYPIAVNGDAHAGTFSPYRSGGYSTYFDGSGGDYVKSPTHADFGFSTDDFTIECWYYPVSKAQNYPRIWHFGPYWSNANALAFQDRHNSWSTTFSLVAFSGGEILNSTTTVENGNWYHLVVERSGTTITLYVNGVAEDTYNIGTSQFITSSTSYVTIGNVSDGANLNEAALNGYIRDFRYVKGTAVYNGNFTPTTEPLEVITNTKLFTAYKPYIIDGSTNSHSITVNGNVSTKPFSPYDYNEYSTTDHGGSVYFDGSGDSLQTSTIIPASSNFTLEGWVYSTSTDSTQVICGQRTNSGSGRFALEVNAGNINFFKDGAGSGYTTSNLEALNKWCHFVLMRTSNNLALYVNGVRKLNTTSGTFEQTNFEVGTDAELDALGLNYGLYGFVSDLRVSLSAKYSEGTSVAVPTAPLSSTGAELHIKGTDASIIDKSQGSNLKLEGSTTGSTTQVKFAGTKSMKFDSLDDKISVSGVLDLSQACTWEAWVYFDNHPTASGFMHMFQSASYSSTDPPFGIRFKTTGGAKINFVLYTTSGNHEVQTASGVALDTWHHLAFSRTSSGVYNIYLNGTRYATFTESATYQSAGDVMVIGNSGTGSTTARHLDGYMQDIRITQGLARYTAADETSNIPSASLEG